MVRFVLKNRVWFILAVLVLSLVTWFNGSPKEGVNSQEVTKTAVEPKPQGLGEVTADEVPVLKTYQEALAFKRGGDLTKAKEVLQTIYNEHPDFESIEQVQQQLESINLELLFSARQTPNTIIHEVVTGDTLGKLAQKYHTTIELIKKSNKLKSDIIRIGQRLRIWTAPFNIYVDKSQNILMVKTGEEVLKVYQVSTGEDASTPIGNFTIITRLKDPVWFNKGVIVPPDSPANVLGTRWLGFDTPSYGIHGTIDPETIGQQITAGCVRMRNNEVEELYSFIPRGTKVTIVD